MTARERLLDSFLNASHGDLKSLNALHDEAVQQDPLLYGSLARWYQQHGSLRDHHELFAAHSLVSPFPEHRENGMVLLQTLRPYQVARVVRYSKETLKYGTRILRSAVRFYLRRREANPAWFDECVIRDKRSMKYLYSTLRLRPEARAEQTLFAEKPPADSRVAVMRRLVRLASRPDLQAGLIREHRIQFAAARGAITNLTPDVLMALTELMTPAQLITNLSFLEKRGAFTHAGLRQVIQGKLDDLVRESRVCDFKALVALRRISADKALADRILSSVGERLRGRGRITVPTALLVDKSGSMDQCIEIGKLMAVLCGTIADAPLYVEAFDSHSFTVKPRESTFAGWEEAFRRVQASGSTSIGVALKKLAGTPLEQVVLISDGQENTAPYFGEEARRWPNLKIFWIQVGGGGDFRAPLDGLDLTTIRFRGDYYNLPNLIPMLCPGSQRQMIDEVLAAPPYTRADLEHLPPGFDEATCEIL